MKTIVSIQDLVELEIKPDVELKEFYSRTEKDIQRWWGDGRALVAVACPACGSRSGSGEFEKWGFTYRECSACASLYVERRPNDAELTRYYRESDAAAFWRERVLARTGAARREKVIAPRVQWVLDGLAEYAPDSQRLVDLSSHARSFLEILIESTDSPAAIVAANPVADADLAGFTSSKVQVRPSALDDLGRLGPADAVTAFDVLDRCSNVPAMVSGLREVVKPGGLLFVTLPTSSGFEVQVLWDRSPTMTPPDKLNVLSIEGIVKLFADGWEILELSTPGMFDVEVVRRSIAAGNKEVPRFVRYLIERRGPAAVESFVEFLQMNRMTSFARLLARRASP